MIDGVIGDNFRLDSPIDPSAEKPGHGIVERLKVRRAHFINERCPRIRLAAGQPEELISIVSASPGQYASCLRIQGVGKGGLTKFAFKLLYSQRLSHPITALVAWFPGDTF